MSSGNYYFSYNERYRKVYAAGVENWGHSFLDKTLRSVLTEWVMRYGLSRRRVIEFACGEGAGGVILSELGCVYHGVDAASLAVEKARKALRKYPDATVSLLDMVASEIEGPFEAALDVMGLHMLVTDEDRSRYLRKAFSILSPHAPMLFFRELYDSESPDRKVNSFEDWEKITGVDYQRPEPRTISQNGRESQIFLPRLPARAKSREGYSAEMQMAGFVVDDILEMEASDQVSSSVSIYVHKP